MKLVLIADQLNPAILPFHTSVSTVGSFIHIFLISEPPQIESADLRSNPHTFFESNLSVLLSHFCSSHLALPSGHYDDRTDVRATEPEVLADYNQLFLHR